MTSQRKPLTLHAHILSPNSLKVAIILEILKLPYAVKNWDIDASSTGLKGPIFYAINENGQVPALEDPNTGVTSWESEAVMKYLLREYDIDNLLGPAKDDSKQDLVDFDKWKYFLLSTFGPMSEQASWYRYDNEVKNEDAFKRYEAQTYRCYDVLEGHLDKMEGKQKQGLGGAFGLLAAPFIPG